MGPKFLGEIQIDTFPLYKELGQEKQVLAPKERTIKQQICCFPSYKACVPLKRNYFTHKGL